MNLSAMKSPSAIPVMLFFLIITALFGPIFWGPETLFSVDGPPVYEQSRSFFSRLAFNIGMWRSDHIGLGLGLGGNTFHPLQLGYAWSHEWHGMRYVVATVATFAGFSYFLIGLGLSRHASFTAALAFCFSGYSFTLISAGHHGFFQATSYMVWGLACIHRAILRNSAWHFAGTGACMIYGMAAQPDFMAPSYILFATYALFLFVHRFKQTGISTLKRVAPRALLTLLVFGLLGLSSFRFLFETVVPGREAQRGTTAEEKWIFATNWSFPPSEVLEFIAPNVYGVENITQETPYWGKIGRSISWDQDRQGFKNFRQHSVYLGVIQLVFALLALHIAIRRKQELDPLLRKLILFWGMIGITALLLSFGRHFFLYRIWYALPYLDLLRAPIKFLRFVELSTCVLMGIGLHLVWQQLNSTEKPTPPDHRSLWKHHSFFCFGMVGLLFLILLNFTASSSRFMEIWQAQGVAALAQPLTQLMVKALSNGIILFAVAGGLLWWSAVRMSHSSIRPLWLWVIPLAVALDSGRLCSTYINTRDLTPMYAENPVAAKMLEAAPHARMQNYLTPRQRLQPLTFNWAANGMTSLGPSQDKPIPERFQQFFTPFQRNPIKLHQLTSTPFAIGQAQQLGTLPAASFEVFTHFQHKDNQFRLALDKAPLQAIRFKNTLPRAAVYHQWISGPDNLAEQASLLANPNTPLEQLLLYPKAEASPAPGGPMTPAEIDSISINRMACKVVTDRPGILMTTDTYHPDTVVKVNGETQTLLECNGLMRGVWLEAGEHSVEFIYQPYLVPWLLNIAVTLLLVISAPWTLRPKPTPA